MFQRKLRAFAVVLLATLALAPIDSTSQTTRKKQTSSASKRRTTKKTAKRPVRRAAPAVPAVSATSPRTVAALRGDMASMVGRIRSGQFGVMAVSLTRGDTLFQHEAGTPLMPASTMKMLTSAAAFERLGPHSSVQHRCLYTMERSEPDGTLTGNVYLRGDGDPSLSGRYMPGGPEAPMNFLADQLVARGVKRSYRRWSSATRRHSTITRFRKDG